jgi:hypothetical protein
VGARAWRHSGSIDGRLNSSAQIEQHGAESLDPTEKIACVLGVHQPGVPQQQNVIMGLGQ